MKKKLNKNEKALLAAIEELQNRSVMELKFRAVHLKKTAEDLIKSIDEKGVKGYYSANNDCLIIAEKVWRQSMRLGEMKKFEDEIRETFKNFQPSKSKKPLKKSKE